jgi:hypothetical protein
MTPYEVSPLFEVQMQDTKREKLTYITCKTKNCSDFAIISKMKTEIASIALSLDGYQFDKMLDNKFPRFVKI